MVVQTDGGHQRRTRERTRVELPHTTGPALSFPICAGTIVQNCGQIVLAGGNNAITIGSAVDSNDNIIGIAANSNTITIVWWKALHRTAAVPTDGAFGG